MSIMKHHEQLAPMLAGIAISMGSASADAETRSLYLGETGIMPKKLAVSPGDRMVISNGTKTRHTVEITGGSNWFGRRSIGHDLAVPVYGHGVAPINSEALKPGSYNVECGIHKRMRATIVVRDEPDDDFELPREGERGDRVH